MDDVIGNGYIPGVGGRELIVLPPGDRKGLCLNSNALSHTFRTFT